MKKILCGFVLCGVLLSGRDMRAASFVYNLPLDRSNFIAKSDCEDKHHFLSSLITGFGAFEVNERYATSDSFGGLLWKLRYDFDSFWIQLKTGIAKKISNRKSVIPESGISFDDIVLSTGYDFRFGEKSYVNCAVLAGFPTVKNGSGSSQDVLMALTSPFGYPEVGSGAYSVGFIVDSAACYSSDYFSDQSLIAEMQFVHYFPTSRFFSSDIPEFRFLGYTIPSSTVAIDINTAVGNRLDFLIGNHSRWGNHHFETGYDATIDFGASSQRSIISASLLRHLTLDFNNKVKTGCRHTFYGDYNYAFALNDYAGGSLGLGMYYSFRPATSANGVKTYGNRLGFYANLSFTF